MPHLPHYRHENLREGPSLPQPFRPSLSTSPSSHGHFPSTTSQRRDGRRERSQTFCARTSVGSALQVTVQDQRRHGICRLVLPEQCSIRRPVSSIHERRHGGGSGSGDCREVRGRRCALQIRKEGTEVFKVDESIALAGANADAVNAWLRCRRVSTSYTVTTRNRGCAWCEKSKRVQSLSPCYAKGQALSTKTSTSVTKHCTHLGETL